MWEVLNKLGSIARLGGVAAGEPVAIVGQKDPFCVVVVAGRLKAGNNGSTVEFGPGDVLFRSTDGWQTNLVGASSSKILWLNEQEYRQLNVQQQVLFHKLVGWLLATRQNELRQDLAITAGQSQVAGRVINDTVSTTLNRYEQCPALMEALKGIRRLPVTVISLLDRITNENLSVHKSVNAVNEDPAIAAEVLKTVNSAYYGLKVKIADLARAIMLLGHREVYNLVVSCHVEKAFPGVELIAYREHSIAISHIAFFIAGLSGTIPPTEASTLGLIHDIGVLVKQAVKRKENFGEALDPDVLGAMLLKLWGLPGLLWKAVLVQKNASLVALDNFEPESRTAIAILSTAHAAWNYLTDQAVEENNVYWSLKFLGLKDHLQNVVSQKLGPLLLKQKSTLPVFLAAAVEGKRLASASNGNTATLKV